MKCSTLYEDITYCLYDEEGGSGTEYGGKEREEGRVGGREERRERENKWFDY